MLELARSAKVCVATISIAGVLKKKDTALTKILKKMSILSCHAQKAWYLTQLKLGS
ncbi:MAG: hypothetical protein ACRCT1_22275 [Microcoleaceae cyanobacterium]